MAKKIFLSPSSQTDNRYAAGNTTEAVQCRRIADFTEKALKRCGFEVYNDKTGSMYTRVAASNKWGANLHIPIHTNAFNGKVSGTRIYCYNLTGYGYRASRAVYDTLAPITPGKSENVTANPGLYEIKNANAPTIYIEAEFHDVPDIARWIIAHVEDIGEAICKGVCNYYGVKYVPPVEPTPEPEPTPGKTWYRIIETPMDKEKQLMSLSSEEMAKEYIADRKSEGITNLEIRKVVI